MVPLKNRKRYHIIILLLVFFPAARLIELLIELNAIQSVYIRLKLNLFSPIKLTKMQNFVI